MQKYAIRFLHAVCPRDRDKKRVNYFLA